MQNKIDDGRTSEAVTDATGQCFEMHQSLQSCGADDDNSGARVADNYPRIAELVAHESSESLMLKVLRIQVQRQSMLPAEPQARQCESLLTPREAQVLEWASRGKSNPEIATILGISQWTVKIHMSQVLRKLNASTRGHAIAKVAAKSLINSRSE